MKKGAKNPGIRSEATASAAVLTGMPIRKSKNGTESKWKQPSVIAAAPVTSQQRLVLRLLIVVGLTTLAIFLSWLFKRQHAGFRPLYILLLLSIGYKVLKVLFEWYHYWAIRQPLKAPVSSRRWTVDMLTTAMPGEPFEMIRETLEAMVAVRYPHTTYLCDEGNDPQLKALCASLGVRHMTREIKVDAKAGNINHALRSATGEICVILDPDHKPVPQMLDEVLPYFEDGQIGFVQTVQAYKNAGESFVAKGAAEQTYTFYGPLMMGMSTYGTAQAIGANCVFRRAALDSIGGHAAGLSEDMHTAMQLHAKGWKSLYLPKILTRGLVPSDIGAYYKQQLKWSRGTFELLIRVLPGLFARLNWRQRLHYTLIPLHFAAGIIALIDMVIPLAALLTGEAPLLLEFSRAYLYLLPYFFLVIFIRQYAQRWLLERRERGFHLTGGVLLFGTWWVHLVGFVYTLLRVKVPYIPTPKEQEYRNNIGLSMPNIIMVLASIGMTAYGLHHDWNPYNHIMAGYACLNTILLALMVWAGQDRLRRSLAAKLKNSAPIALLWMYMRTAARIAINALVELLRKRAPQLAILTTAVFLLLAWRQASQVAPSEISSQKEIGGFYLGVDLPEIQQQQSIQPLLALENELKSKVNVVAVQEFWNEDSLQQLPSQLLDQIAAQGGIPLINWLPVSRMSVVAADAIGGRKGMMTAIAQGDHDAFIHQYADKIRALGHPVFINFAPESDNPAKPWYVNRHNPVRDYIRAVRRIEDIFLESGVNNVTWVWTPWKVANMQVLFPGQEYVDWIGVSLENGEGPINTRIPLEQSFAALHQKGRLYHKPVMITGLKFADDRASVKWLQKAVSDINSRFPEIRSMILGDLSTTQSHAAGKLYATTISGATTKKALTRVLAEIPDLVEPGTFKPVTAPGKAAVKQARQLSDVGGTYQLTVDGQPFYIRGVAYNPQHSWRDGYHPLNRKKLEADFRDIKAMGANTIAGMRRRGMIATS